ncbi:prepilin-type N-terminal cleavage/methylation domain-containing protein [Jatrophihabitans sp. DSM 45814]
MLNKLNKLREERAEGDKGFTLIELLVVVVIIGILIAIAIPLYLNYQRGAKDKSAQSDVRAAVATIEQCYTDNGNNYPVGPITLSGNAYSFTAGCASGKLNISSGTTLTYNVYTDAAETTACTGSATCVAYTISGYNSGGNKAAPGYAYNSTAGGQVK